MYFKAWDTLFNYLLCNLIEKNFYPTVSKPVFGSQKATTYRFYNTVKQQFQKLKLLVKNLELMQ